MYLEAKETARLYKLLSDQLGNDTAEAMFKYIDNRTERSVEASIKTLATKENLALDIANVRGDIAKVKEDMLKEFGNVRKEMGDVSKEIGESKADTIKWMFIFWVGQVGATIALLIAFVKK